MSRHFLSKRDIKGLREDLSDVPVNFDELESLEIEEGGSYTLYYYKRKPFFFRNRRVVPTLILINTIKPTQNRVTVDSGAVPHVAKGAGIFIRGIIEADAGIVDGSLVFVRNADGIYISVGISNTDTEGLLSKSDGEGIHNIHYLEDEIMKGINS